MTAAWSALTSEPAGLSDIAKARALPAPELKALEFDNLSLLSGLSEEVIGDLHQGTLGLDYMTLQSMSRVPVISAIIGTRVGQIAEFCQPPEDETDLGFVVRLKDPDARAKGASKAERKRIMTVTDWLMTCGDPSIDPDATLEGFVSAVTRDSLIYDQACWELVRTRGGDLAGIKPVDAATVRRAKLTDSEKDNSRRDGRSGYLQTMHSQTVARFEHDEMVMGIRRPRTWIHANGYGYPELEELVRTITHLVNAETYNANNFTHGIHAAGILAIKSKMNPQLFRAFRREFYSMLSGASNAKKTPIIQLDPDAKEEISSIAMSNTNREMEYEKWIGWLLRIACSIFQIDSSELGFVYGAENQTNSLVMQGPGDKITASRERGLRPLQRKWEHWINRRVIPELDPSLELKFVGFDQDSRAALMERDQKLCKTFMTINEVRKTRGLEPLDDPTADMILDPSYMSTSMQAASMQQDEGGGEEPGGEEPADDPWAGMLPDEGEVVQKSFRTIDRRTAPPAGVKRVTVEVV